MRIEDAPGGATPDDVAAFEERIGRTLPEGYRRLLVEHNGGRPEPRHWHCGPTRNDPVYGWTPLSVHVGDFLGLADEPDHLSLDWTYRFHSDDLPAGFLGIADDDGGNLIVLALDGLDRNSVWYWHHELGSEEGPDPILKVAPSFEEFLDGLIDWDELERRIELDVQASNRGEHRSR